LLLEGKSLNNVRAMKVLIILFEVITSIKVNFNKSMLVEVNIVDSCLSEAPLDMNCKIGRLHFLYLGLPIGGDSHRGGGVI